MDLADEDRSHVPSWIYHCKVFPTNSLLQRCTNNFICLSSDIDWWDNFGPVTSMDNVHTKDTLVDGKVVSTRTIQEILGNQKRNELRNKMNNEKNSVQLDFTNHILVSYSSYSISITGE